MRKIIMYYFIVILFCCQIVKAQHIKITGVVQDSLKNPLENTNILAISKAEEGVRFGLTDEKGNYQLNLVKNRTYEITSSYMGFDDKKQTLKAIKDTILNFTLLESNNLLNTVVIEQAVVVKKDTILYNPEKFINGRERKLKQILEKLPGIEVDKRGGVTVNGKEVKKLLIDGEIFFTGDPKLGVNNIPADAIKNVEIFDNHSDIAFLKDLEESDVLAMNIKLKENKKKFVFGDITIGVGIADSENYLINPALFYYSPKTTFNFISDITNRGDKSFSLRDYSKFESNSISKSNEDYDFKNYLRNSNFKNSTHQFGALNFRYKFHPKFNFNSYAILCKEKNETETQMFNQYNLEDKQLSENRSNIGNTNTFFSLTKVRLHYTPDAKTDISFNTVVKGDIIDRDGQTITRSAALAALEQYINTNYNNQSYNINQNFEWHKQYSTKHTFSIVGDYNYLKYNPNQQWKTNTPILDNLLPLISLDDYNINQNNNSIQNNFNSTFKHYWLLNRLNHIYTTFGTAFKQQEFKTNSFEILKNNNINSFDNKGFDNNIRYLFNDSYAGLEYKMKKNKLTLKQGLFYHYYTWNPNAKIHTRKSKSYLLPEFKGEYAFKNYEKLSLNYKLETRFSNAESLANRYTLNNFNTLYIGNEDLDNSLAHNISLNYSKSKTYRGYHLHSGLNYRNKVRNIQSATKQTNLNRVQTSEINLLPYQIISWHGSYEKRIQSIKYRLNTHYNLTDYNTKLNTKLLNNQSHNTRIALRARSIFSSKYPNFTVSHSQGFKLFKSSNYKSLFINKTTYCSIDYEFLKHFEINVNYSYTDYKNEKNTILDSFNELNLLAVYQKENSPWTFEIKAKNLLNNQFTNRSSFSNFKISNTQTFIMPRVALLKVTYKI